MILDGAKKAAEDALQDPTPPHQAWLAFIRFCAELKHGEIDRSF